MFLAVKDTQTDNRTDQRASYGGNIDFINAELPQPEPLDTVNDASIFHIVFVHDDCIIVFLLVQIMNV